MLAEDADVHDWGKKGVCCDAYDAVNTVAMDTIYKKCAFHRNSQLKVVFD